MIRGSVKQEIITGANIQESNIDTPKFTKQTLADIKGEIESNTTVVGEGKTPHKLMERSSRQQINDILE